MSSSTPPRSPLTGSAAGPVDRGSVEPIGARSRHLRGWLIALGVLAAVLVVSVVVLITVVRPLAYEPVPIPSVSST